MKPSDLHWYALRVPANKEFAAAEALQVRGYATFVPYETRWRRANRYVKRKVERHFPLMPRYVFTGFREAVPPWLEVFKMALVQSVVTVSSNGEPSLVRPTAIAELMRVYGERPLRAPASQRFMLTHKEFAEGDEVRIAEGPFRDQVVKVDSISGHTAKVMLPLFGVEQGVAIDLAKLEAA